MGGGEDTIKIFITGGSTSDIVFRSYNWPVLLFERLKSSKIKCEVYIGAVGGYGTSQELLKLLRDGLVIPNLDFHISYFGANEEDESSYSSEYEYNLFEKSNSKYVFIPNTISLINERLLKNYNLYITPKSKVIAFEQTIKNLKIMHSISKVYNYKYIPILQPVIGVGSLENSYKKYNLNKSKKNENLKSDILLYSKFYKSLKENNQLFMLATYDFTNIFKDVDDNPLLDDCHVKEKYQHMISDKIFDLIMKDSVQIN